MSIIKSKRRRPESLGYNSWMPLAFPPVTLGASLSTTAVQAALPLGLSVKIVAVSYVITGTVAGQASVNIVSGFGAYETAGSSASGTVTLGGSFAVGDSATINIGAISVKTVFTQRSGGILARQAAGVARGLNRNTAFSNLYYATASGPVVIIQTKSYSTAGNATTLTASVTSAAGTAVASGATLTGGTNGVMPVVPPNDTTQIGIVPPITATAGQALFPVDAFIVPQANAASIMYPPSFDAIFGSLSNLTLRVATNASASGVLQMVLWVVPVDTHPMSPEETNNGFLPGLEVL